MTTLVFIATGLAVYWLARAWYEPIGQAITAALYEQSIRDARALLDEMARRRGGSFDAMTSNPETGEPIGMLHWEAP